MGLYNEYVNRLTANKIKLPKTGNFKFYLIEYFWGWLT